MVAGVRNPEVALAVDGQGRYLAEWLGHQTLEAGAPNDYTLDGWHIQEFHFLGKVSTRDGAKGTHLEHAGLCFVRHMSLVHYKRFGIVCSQSPKFLIKAWQ